MIREYIKPLPIEDILVDHSEEAAFMYESRCRSFVDPELCWEDLREIDQRMIPHLHGLSLGGMTTAKLLKDKFLLKEDEEPGEAFVAATVYPMLNLVEPMQWMLDALSQNPPHLPAIVDGLKFSKAPSLEGWLEYFLQHHDPAVRAVGAIVIGYRRDNALKDKLFSLRNGPELSASMAAIFALAELNMMPDKNALVPILNSMDPVHTITAIELLLRMGTPDAVHLCREKCTAADFEAVGSKIKERSVLYLAVSGTVDDIQIINKLITEQSSSKKNGLLALGLCGNASSVDVLIDQLGNVDDLDVFTAAYQGLRFITGIDYLPQFDPDEVEPNQIIEYQNLWKSWWHSNRNDFASNLKWRRGERISPVVLYNELLRRGNPCRHMTYLEMVIRYGCTVDFQYDQSYEIQAAQLQGINSWVKQHANKFQQGMPYYNGGALL